MTDRCLTIAAACQALLAGHRDSASKVLGAGYPFVPAAPVERRYGPLDCTRVFIRDGFIDRYTGLRLIFPPVLRLISDALPTDFPYHLNWKTDVTHPAYYEVAATVDHLVPVSHGGTNDQSNLVTTSMARNSAKMNWSIDELGWKLHPPGCLDDWDGLLGWFSMYLTANPEMLENRKWLRPWRQAAGALLTDRHQGHAKSDSND